MSGNFANPGLYVGYLIIALPLIVSYLYRDSVILFKRYSKFLAPFYLRWFLCFLATILIVFILIKVDKRAAYISAIISFPVMALGIKWKTVKKRLLKNRLLSCLLLFLFICVVVFVSIKLYNQKLGSSQVRFKVGVITLNAISNNLQGVGIGCFSKVYNPEQIKYNQEHVENSQKLNFIAPYAYNEFLQIGVEFGILGLVCFLLIVCSSFIKGLRYRKYGYVGSLIALHIFSLMWYPYLFISFIICLLFYIANSVTKYKKKPSNKIINSLLVVLLFISAICVKLEISRYIAYREFDKLINNPLEATIDKYEKLYPDLQSDVRFLMGYVAFLTSNNEYRRSVDVLNRLKCIYSKREVLLALSKNNLLLGDTIAAENNILDYYYLNVSDKKTNYVMADFYLRIGNREKSHDYIEIVKKVDTTSYSIKALEEQLEIIKTKPD